MLSLRAAADQASLPPTDMERAEAEASAPHLREGFLARRRLLRRAVGLRLGASPGDVLIARDAQGAPRVTSAREPIFVSLAARGELVAIALSDRPVGVDVEPIEATAAPAWNILHPGERAWLRAQRAEEQAEKFLALWCIKEAYLKAIGLGLRREPAKIAVNFFDGADRISVEDAGRVVALDSAFVTRTEAHGVPAVVACVVLVR
ncbi:MAG: 4'-phosphopantetheinyl transferase superfamily protein [Methylobacteriaceae bacterium]|nr:4'-phosphopantetheinyl transferase superfamily protein [Methylobacteriaceae bacterium]